MLVRTVVANDPVGEPAQGINPDNAGQNEKKQGHQKRRKTIRIMSANCRSSDLIANEHDHRLQKIP